MFPTPVKFPSIVGSATVTSIGEDFSTGCASGSWSADETRINRTYSTQVKVCFLQSVGPLCAIQATGVKIGDIYRYPLFSGFAVEQDTGSFVQAITPSKDSEDGKQWMVTIDYGPFDIPSLLGTAYLSQGIIDPTARAWEVYWDSAKYRISRPYDQSNPPLPYINSINDPLIDPPETEETRPVLKLLHNEQTYNEAIANQYRDTVNQDTFLGCDPNTVKCRDIRGEMAWDADWAIVWRVTYEFEFRVNDPEQNGYYQMLINQGYRYIDSNGKLVNAVDDLGSQVTDPVLLSKSGSKLTNGKPYFLQFSEFPQVPFESLNIPQDILSRSTF